MADVDSKLDGNVPGKYYVDDTCSACGVCSETAPDHFKLTDDEENAFVYKQPANDAEIELCEEAMEDCPEESIGNNGA